MCGNRKNCPPSPPPRVVVHISKQFDGAKNHSKNSVPPPPKRHSYIDDLTGTVLPISVTTFWHGLARYSELVRSCWSGISTCNWLICPELRMYIPGLIRFRDSNLLTNNGSPVLAHDSKLTGRISQKFSGLIRCSGLPGPRFGTRSNHLYPT